MFRNPDGNRRDSRLRPVISMRFLFSQFATMSFLWSPKNLQQIQNKWPKNHDRLEENAFPRSFPTDLWFKFCNSFGGSKKQQHFDFERFRPSRGWGCCRIFQRSRSVGEASTRESFADAPKRLQHASLLQTVLQRPPQVLPQREPSEGSLLLQSVARQRWVQRLEMLFYRSSSSLKGFSRSLHRNRCAAPLFD